MGKLAVKPFTADYLHRLTDDTGIFQHTKFGIPDRSKGYTSDDNARALIAAVMLFKNSQDNKTLNLISIYSSFLYHAQNEDGSFRNFMDYQRVFIEQVGSEDCLGRCLWALGFTLSEASVPDNIQNTCRYMINQALSHVKSLTSPRAMAYAMIGLTYMLETPQALTYKFPYPGMEQEDPAFLPQAQIASLVEELAMRLHTQYQANKGDGWLWFEDSITYGNAMLPWALFKASQLTSLLQHTEQFRLTAKESLDYLASITFAQEGYFKPIGSHGWLTRGQDAARFDEQPIEACEMLLACMEAYKVLREPTYYAKASLCYDWFHGRNSRQESLIDAQTGACFDGIHASGLNLNQGSENIVSYCMAKLVMQHE
ncbi:glycosyltransferase [Paenibacillus ferrarius]|uniref:Glycosyltransferase n=1 Tax=Paenibacillus ferrarius TaxID=1469647 RepID=A0A1V4HJQ2_9BACL|nr:glycosyltransferase [Paenibacillus ferrarius]OPH56706.1 glycosyltransferase [Paenibacillus ferrarius]